MASSIDEAQAAKDAEWGQYVAVQVIEVGGVRAFNPGDPVPVSHVQSGVVPSDAVATRNTPARPKAADLTVKD